MSLFHYSDIRAVQSILTNGEFWFTHMDFLNDKAELQTGMGEIINWLEIYELVGYEGESKNKAYDFISEQLQYSAKNPDAGYGLFTCSFSSSENSLGQWRAYGKFAIELDKAVLADSFVLYDCIYTEAEKRSAAASLGHEVVDGLSQDITPDGTVGPNGLAQYGRLLIEAAKFKNEHFQEEREVRAVISGYFDSDEVCFRDKSDYLVPYIKMDFDIKAVKAIHVGPTPNQDMAEKSLKALLLSLDLSHIPIVLSDIPFRS